MNYLPIVLFTVAFGAASGTFEYWMATRLDKKRWLLLLQPALFAVISGCMTAWALSIDNLKGSPARLAGSPFAVMLVIVVACWIAGTVKRRGNR